MTTTTLRKIIRIDEEKCNGCGVCVPACAEGALQIIDGKAKLISETYCDGLGACLGECPQGAITIEERTAEEFDEEAVKHHLEEKEPVSRELPCGCPSATVTQFGRQEATMVTPRNAISQQSMLSHWPVQLTLVPPSARLRIVCPLPMLASTKTSSAVMLYWWLVLNWMTSWLTRGS